MEPPPLPSQVPWTERTGDTEPHHQSRKLRHVDGRWASRCSLIRGRAVVPAPVARKSGRSEGVAVVVYSLASVCGWNVDISYTCLSCSGNKAFLWGKILCPPVRSFVLRAVQGSPFFAESCTLGKHG